MRCIYFINGECHAQPFADKGYEYFHPDEQDQKYCMNTLTDDEESGEDDFTYCPRYQAYLDYLRATRLDVRLRKLDTLVVREVNLKPVLTEFVDEAIAVTNADFGNIQLLDPKSGDLQIAAHRGFPQWWLEFWNSVTKGRGSCGTALQSGERVIVEDVENSPIFAGTALDMQLKAGVRAVQSTPLVSRSGKIFGMFSTHYRSPHRPDDRALRLIDLLAIQAADIIEHAPKNPIN